MSEEAMNNSGPKQKKKPVVSYFFTGRFAAAISRKQATIALEDRPQKKDS